MHTESDRIALEALMGLVSVPGASKNKKQRQEKRPAAAVCNPHSRQFMIPEGLGSGTSNS